MKKIIIDYDDTKFSASEALLRVEHVVAQGKVSTCKSGDHYCWATIWKDDTVVWTRRKDHSQAADSFKVYMDHGNSKNPRR